MNHTVLLALTSGSHPVWHSWIHSYGLFTLLLYHQVHVVVFQDGDHLYLHGTFYACAQQCATLPEEVVLVHVAYIDSHHANIGASC